ncbi:hypothetical protein HYZ99_01105 [Candidatus Peregrinibacteria bacterium]|nr:hypothetical protein [Candidatus Peregrinibacteria bacterium]
MKLALRTILLGCSALLCTGLLVEQTSAASGMVTIGQMSRNEVIGTWVLKLPNGQTVESTDPFVDASFHTIKNAPTGTYTVTFEAPRGAESSVTVTTGSQKETFAGLAQTFTLTAGEDARVIAEYEFDGVIKVQSDPSGVNFRLTASNGVDLTGTTPARFSNLPPLPYSVYYSAKDGCVTPKPQHRDLDEARPLIFSVTYACGDVKRPVQPKKEKPEENGRETPGDTQRRANVARLDIDTFTTQTEVLPGGTLLMQIRLYNPSNKVLRNLEIVQAYDPSQVSVSGNLPRGGTTRDNTIVWNLNDLQPRERWTVTIELKANDTLAAGTMVDVNTTATSDDLPRSVGDITSVTVVTGLPQTGGMLDLFVVVLSGALAAGILRMHRRRVLGL